jgi:predicted ribosome quality control (RQC) complex YloA/Tae2 family protein
VTAGSLTPARPARSTLGPRPTAAAEVPPKLQPRRFRTRDGWEVWIGKTNEGNDYLTHRLARPEDYWFHVQGSPGSHVVLRRGKGKDEPSRDALREAAAWAAFFSRQRTSGAVPVLYTRKKYVRKPRGAKPGLAEVMRDEKTLFVRPQEPPETAALPEEEPA